MKKTRAIKDFVKKWRGNGKERQDAHPFWEELVECLLDAKHGRDYLNYEKPVPKPSIIHMAWVKVVGGRMKSDYRYTIEIVYNNSPWPKGITSEQTNAIEQTASQILDARKNHHQSTLRQLYNPAMMPKDLTEAHQANDRAVLAAYASMGVRQDMGDEEIAHILLRESVRLSTKAKSKNKA